jgi:hypothetical protein
VTAAPGQRRAAWLGAAAPAALLWCAGCVDDGGPRIDRVSPAAAPAGAMVEVLGERFCADEAGADCARDVAGYVTFGLEPPQRRGQVVSWTDRRVEVVVPSSSPAGRADVIVTVDGRSSNAFDFEVQ